MGLPGVTDLWGLAVYPYSQMYHTHAVTCSLYVPYCNCVCGSGGTAPGIQNISTGRVTNKQLHTSVYFGTYSIGASVET